MRDNEKVQHPSPKHWLERYSILTLESVRINIINFEKWGTLTKNKNE
jgi:hypothetical protein